MKKLLSALILSPLFFTACQSNSDRLNDVKTIEITSIPEGATIVINNLNLGKTPISVEFAANEFGCFIRPASITALAQEPSLFTQVKTYPRFSENTKEESKIPSSLEFDMTLSPQAAAEAAKAAK